MANVEPILEPTTEFRPQVYIMMNDSVLETLYRQKMNASNFCLVWNEHKDAWENSLDAFAYDVIVVDFSLFENPLEALRRMRRIAPDAEIIVLSNQQDVQTAIAAFKVGIADYYLKPVNPETLSWAIEKILRQKALKSNNAALNADLHVFSVTHHINIAETDNKMRELAMRHLIRLCDADGGVWITRQANKTTYDFFQCSADRGKEAVDLFEAENPRIIEDSFTTHLTSHPEYWFRDRFLWIPLQQPSLGGLFLFGTKRRVELADQARVEFLIRNLEVSLENHRRYIEAKQLTYIDDLTGLYNSRYLDVAITSAIQNTQGFAVLFIDIDRFKSVNDTHGHVIGSQLLTALGKTFKNQLRGADLLFRYGGDEFIALLNDRSIDEAKDIAERLRKNVEKRAFHFQKVTVNITISIGIARFPDHGKDKKVILDMADQAMYHSKKTGRNKVFISGK